MIIELYADYWERFRALLAFEVYNGINLEQVLIGALVAMMLIFVISGPRNRGVFGRVFDLGIVLFAIALLAVCIALGLYVGHEYEHEALGAFAGVMLFAGIFFVINGIATRRRNRDERAKLAAFLKSKSRG